jgi:hypothetical protein
MATRRSSSARWVANGFAAPGCTAGSLYYSVAPAPGVRFVFLDTYDLSAGQFSSTNPLGRECEASSDGAFADAKRYLEDTWREHYRKRFSVSGEELMTDSEEWAYGKAWHEYPKCFSGDELVEAYASQLYNGGVGAAQEEWLEVELRTAQAAGEAVFVFGHCPAHPFTCKPDGLMWRAARLRAALERFPCVEAYIAGHDHDGGYFCLETGVHYLVPPAPLESDEDECFGMIKLGDGGLDARVAREDAARGLRDAAGRVMAQRSPAALPHEKLPAWLSARAPVFHVFWRSCKPLARQNHMYSPISEYFQRGPMASMLLKPIPPGFMPRARAARR